MATKLNRFNSKVPSGLRNPALVPKTIPIIAPRINPVVIFTTNGIFIYRFHNDFNGLSPFLLRFFVLYMVTQKR